MRKVILFTILCVVASIASLTLPTKAKASQGDIIQCHCTRDISFHPNGCYVNAKGPVCAQSEPGGNVNCADYNSNCA